MKGQSSVVGELLLIMIAIFLSAVVLAIVNNMMAYLGNPNFFKLPEVLEISEAVPYYTPTTGRYFLITVRVPKTISLKGVAVYYQGVLICSSSTFVLSSADPSARSYSCRALVPAGYYGEVKGAEDPYDAPCPGAIFFSLNCTEPVKAIGYADVGNGWYAPYDPTTGEQAPSWATVSDFVPEALVARWCETSLSATYSKVSFAGPVGRVKVLYNGTSWVSVEGFNSVKLGEGVYTVVLWCPHIMPPLSGFKVVLETDVAPIVAYAK